MTILPVPCLRDNYAYILLQDGGQEALVVDPSEAAPVRAALSQGGLDLVGILCTHHHADHVGGNLELAEGRVPIFGHRSDQARIPGLTHPLDHGAVFSIAGFTFRALHVPGHTLGALTYVGDGFAFTGDTLFCGGCGRLFEGTAQQMHHSLSAILGELPDSCEIYTGHEYTEANLRFAMACEPGNAALQERFELVRQRRQSGGFCAAASLALERATNPFLRCHSQEIRRRLELPDATDVEVFAELRRRKNSF